MNPINSYKGHIDAINQNLFNIINKFKLCNQCVNNDNDSLKEMIYNINREFLDQYNTDYEIIEGLFQQYQEELSDLNTQLSLKLNAVSRLAENHINKIHDSLISFTQRYDTILSDMKTNSQQVEKNTSIAIDFSNHKRHTMDILLILKYPSSCLYQQYCNHDSDQSLYLGINDENFDSIVKYMNDECINLTELKSQQIKSLISDLEYLSLPVKRSFFMSLYSIKPITDFNSVYNNKKVLINNVPNAAYSRYIKNENLLDNILNMMSISTMKYNVVNRCMQINIHIQNEEIIKDYLMNSHIHENIIKENSTVSIHSILEDFKKLNIILSKEDMDIISMYLIEPSTLFKNTRILDNKYNDILSTWIGKEKKWKLLYSAKRDGDSSEKFHQLCDDKGPTFLVIKVINLKKQKCIFGGYTDQSWKFPSTLSSSKYNLHNENGFLYSLENPFKLNPCQFFPNDYGCITSSPNLGPSFGTDLIISSLCIKSNESSTLLGSSYINSTEYGYSLFTNSNSPDQTNIFSVDDYEVFNLENYEDYLESMKFDFKNEIYDYYNTKSFDIQTFWKRSCKKDINKLLIFFKEIQHSGMLYYDILLELQLFIPAISLNNSLQMNSEYIQYINEWIGTEYTWKRCYQGSQNNGNSFIFHHCCDMKGPTLSIIKAINNDNVECIFGAYTSVSWKPDFYTKEYNWKYDPDMFIFSLKNPSNKKPFKIVMDTEHKIVGCYNDILLNMSSLLYINQYCLLGNCSYVKQYSDIENKDINCLDFITTDQICKEYSFTVKEIEVYSIDNFKKYAKSKSIYYLNDICKYQKNGYFDDDTFYKQNKHQNRIILTQLSLDLQHVGLPYMNIIDQLLDKFSPEFIEDSLLLDSKYIETIDSWIGIKYKWKLCFRLSRDGEHCLLSTLPDMKTRFHSKCDSLKPSIIIYKCITEDNIECIFGGYTSMEWKSQSKSSYVKFDPSAFIFTISNPCNTVPMKLKTKNCASNLYCNDRYGPSFRRAISVPSNCFYNDFCSMELSYSYENPNTSNDAFFLTSEDCTDCNFTITDYEVYSPLT